MAILDPEQKPTLNDIEPIPSMASRALNPTPGPDYIPPAEYKPEGDALVENRMTGLLDQGSRYIENARQRGTELAQSRGLLNSSISAGASERAAIEGALPIASQDAASIQAAGMEGYKGKIAGAQTAQAISGQSVLSTQEAEQAARAAKEKADYDWRAQEAKLASEREISKGANETTLTQTSLDAASRERIARASTEAQITQTKLETASQQAIAAGANAASNWRTQYEIDKNIPVSMEEIASRERIAKISTGSAEKIAAAEIASTEKISTAQIASAALLKGMDLDTQIKVLTKQADLQGGYTDSNGVYHKGLIEIEGAIKKDIQKDQLDNVKEMAGINFANEIKLLAKQYDNQAGFTDSDGVVHRGTIEIEGAIKREIQKDQLASAEKLTGMELDGRIKELATQYNNQAGFTDENGVVHKGTIEIEGAIRKAISDDQLANAKELTGMQLDGKIKEIAKMYDTQAGYTDENGVVHKGTLEIESALRREVQKDQLDSAKELTGMELNNKIVLLANQYNNEAGFIDENGVVHKGIIEITGAVQKEIQKEQLDSAAELKGMELEGRIKELVQSYNNQAGYIGSDGVVHKGLAEIDGAIRQGIQDSVNKTNLELSAQEYNQKAGYTDKSGVTHTGLLAIQGALERDIETVRQEGANTRQAVEQTFQWDMKLNEFSAADRADINSKMAMYGDSYMQAIERIQRDPNVNTDAKVTAMDSVTAIYKNNMQVVADLYGADLVWDGTTPTVKEKAPADTNNYAADGLTAWGTTSFKDLTGPSAQAVRDAFDSAYIRSRENGKSGAQAKVMGSEAANKEMARYSVGP